MPSYEAIVSPMSGDVLNGDIRRQAKVNLLHYMTPDGKPRKAGSRTVKAWTSLGLRHAAKDAAMQLMAIDKRKRQAEITSKIDRIENAIRVNLTKEE